jgi:hypothetical protein
MKLHAINKKKPTEEFMGRKREFVQETSPDSRSGAWGCVRCWGR